MVVHQNYSELEELGCSRWSFTRIRGGARVLPLVVHQKVGYNFLIYHGVRAFGGLFW